MKGGQPERVTLGRFPAMTVEQARKQATAVNAEIEAGGNPAAARRAIRVEQSFGEVFDDFLKKKRKRDGTPLGERTKRDYSDVLRLYLEPIKARKLSQITRADIKAIHTKVTKRSAAQADAHLLSFLRFSATPRTWSYSKVPVPRAASRKIIRHLVTASPKG
jgi:hypothetical protein